MRKLSTIVLLAVLASLPARADDKPPLYSASVLRSVDAVGVIGSRVLNASATIDQASGVVHTCVALRDVTLQRTERGCADTGTATIATDFTHADLTATVPTSIFDGNDFVVCVLTASSNGPASRPRCSPQPKSRPSAITVSLSIDGASVPSPMRVTDANPYGLVVDSRIDVRAERNGSGPAEFTSRAFCARLRGSAARSCRNGSRSVPMSATISEGAVATTWAEGDVLLPAPVPDTSPALWMLPSGGASGGVLRAASAEFSTGRSHFLAEGLDDTEPAGSAKVLCVTNNVGPALEIGCGEGVVEWDDTARTAHFSGVVNTVRLDMTRFIPAFGSGEGEPSLPNLTVSADVVDVTLTNPQAPTLEPEGPLADAGPYGAIQEAGAKVRQAATGRGTVRSLGLCYGLARCSASTKAGQAASKASFATMLSEGAGLYLPL